MRSGLEERGKIAAVNAISRIVHELPHLTWLKYVELAAKENMLRKSWSPPSPRDIIDLCRTRKSRLVRNAADLQHVVVEALHDINANLQGETPAAPDLWNLPTSRADRTLTRPKEEERLSDWLKRSLKAKLDGRGIIPHREVQIRSGERTDILITAVLPQASDARFDDVRLIVEVKGCWNHELRTAMETQLVNRYMTDNNCLNGVYVVEWFLCEQWDGDRRKADTPNWTLETARTYFDEQAVALSNKTRSVQAVVLDATLA